MVCEIMSVFCVSMAFRFPSGSPMPSYQTTDRSLPLRRKSVFI